MKSLFIRDKEIFPPLVFAPMAGLSEKVLRRTMRAGGCLGFVVTELVPVEGLLRSRLKLEDYIEPEDYCYTSLQLAGSVPERMLEAGRMAVEAGVRFIDVNMGCPVSKIVKSCSGAGLMREPERAAAVVKALASNLEVPVTAKIRSGWDEKSMNYLEVAKAVEEAGAAAVTIHPRTRKAMYTGKADWSHIAKLKKQLGIPVIGNGDILSPGDAKRMFDETGCDAVMIGRGAVRNPFIFKQTMELLEKGSYREPTLHERLVIVQEHFEKLIATMEKAQALHFMKIFVGKYTKGMPNSAPLRETLSRVRDPLELLELFRKWREGIPEDTEEGG